MYNDENLELLKDRIVSLAVENQAPAGWVIRRKLSRNEDTAHLSRFFQLIGPRFCRELFGDLSEWTEAAGTVTDNHGENFNAFLGFLHADIAAECDLVATTDKTNTDLYSVLDKFFQNETQPSLVHFDAFQISLILSLSPKTDCDRILAQLPSPLRRRALLSLSRIYRIPYSAALASASQFDAGLSVSGQRASPPVPSIENIWNIISAINISTPEHVMKQLPAIGELSELVNSARTISEFFSGDRDELDQ